MAIGRKTQFRFILNCSPGGAWTANPSQQLLSNCADVQFSLGMAKLHAADFEGALATLRDAETNYVKAEKMSESHKFSAIQVKEQAQTNLWIAVALFQLAKTEEATTTLES
jgi:hypothetical protein